MSTRNRFPTLLLSALLLASGPATADRPSEPDHATSAEPGSPPAPRSEVHRPSGQGPPDREAMRAWHRRYRPLAEPVKKALGDLFRARRHRHRPRELEPQCRALARAVETFRRKARKEEIFPVANAAADVALKRLYRRLGDAAKACLDGRWGAMEGHLHRAARHHKQARLSLRTYGLEP